MPRKEKCIKLTTEQVSKVRELFDIYNNCIDNLQESGLPIFELKCSGGDCDPTTCYSTLFNRLNRAFYYALALINTVTLKPLDSAPENSISGGVEIGLIRDKYIWHSLSTIVAELDDLPNENSIYESILAWDIINDYIDPLVHLMIEIQERCLADS